MLTYISTGIQIFSGLDPSWNTYFLNDGNQMLFHFRLGFLFLLVSPVIDNTEPAGPRASAQEFFEEGRLVRLSEWNYECKHSQMLPLKTDNQIYPWSLHDQE